jgi:quinol monooxygenase YgiN
MIILTATFQAKEGKTQALHDLLQSLVPQTQCELGVLTYKFHRSTTDAARFYFYEKYLSQQAFDEHVQSPYLQHLLQQETELFAVPPVIEFFEEIDGFDRS